MQTLPHLEQGRLRCVRWRVLVGRCAGVRAQMLHKRQQGVERERVDSAEHRALPVRIVWYQQRRLARVGADHGLLDLLQQGRDHVVPFHKLLHHLHDIRES